MELRQEDNLIIQSYITAAFLAELHNNDFLNSDYYKNMKFGNNVVKELLTRLRIENEGALLIMLYAWLVVPKQLLENNFRNEFEALNGVVDKLKSEASSTYPEDSNGINFIRHIRNAVAHVNVQFIPADEPVDKLRSDASSTYPEDTNRIDFIQHDRNEVAHAKVQIIHNKAVKFIDQNKSGKICEITIPLSEIEKFLTELQKVFIKYIDNKMSQ